MTKLSLFLVFLLACSLFLGSLPAKAQLYGKRRIMVHYLDAKPTSKGRLLAVSDSSVQLRIRMVNPAYRDNPNGKHKMYVFDTLTVNAAEMESIRLGPKSKRPILRLTTFGLMGIGLVGGYVLEYQSYFGPLMGVLTGLTYGGLGLFTGIPLGYIIYKLAGKNYAISGDTDKYRAILPKLQESAQHQNKNN